jgi:hypothetical protein
MIFMRCRLIMREQLDAQHFGKGMGGRKTVQDGYGWTHSSLEMEWVDAQQCVPTIY